MLEHVGAALTRHWLVLSLEILVVTTRVQHGHGVLVLSLLALLVERFQGVDLGARRLNLAKGRPRVRILQVLRD